MQLAVALQTGVVVAVRRELDVRLSNGMLRTGVPTDALAPVLRFQPDQYVLHCGWLGRIDFVEEAVTVCGRARSRVQGRGECRGGDAKRACICTKRSSDVRGRYRTCNSAKSDRRLACHACHDRCDKCARADFTGESSTKLARASLCVGHSCTNACEVHCSVVWAALQ